MTTSRQAHEDAQIRRLLMERARPADSTGLLESISGEVATTAQDRPSPLASMAGRAAAIAAIVLLSVVGVAFLTSGPTGPAAPTVQPTATPASPSPSGPAGSPRTIAPAGLEAPPLEPGSWRTVAFQPGFEFNVPGDRWAAGLDVPQRVYLRAHLPGAAADEFNALTIVRIEDVYRDPCGAGVAGGATSRPPSDDATTFLEWLRAETPFDLGAAASTTILGMPATQIEVEIPDGAFDQCAEGYLPFAPMAGGTSQAMSLPRDGQRMRLAVLDAGPDTLLVMTFGSPDRWDALLAATDQVLATARLGQGATPEPSTP